MITSPQFRALNREAALATRLVASGVTTLRKANYAQPGIYTEAFFSLSLGLERLGKLVIVVDHCLQHAGSFPTDADMRKMGHDLTKLWAASGVIRTRYATDEPLANTPSEPIVGDLIEFLSQFAKGSRYYNLDFLVGSAAAKHGDPLTLWTNTVAKPILERHQNLKKRQQTVVNANSLGAALQHVIMVRHESTDGTPIRSVADGMIQSSDEQLALRWAQLYSLQIVRFFSFLLGDLSYESYQRRLEIIPHFSDHLAMFCNADRMLKSRKTWLSP